MRKAVQKHYKSLAPFVTLANLGWDEILRRDGFPSLHELKPDGAHGALLRRISHAFSSNFRALQTCTEIPPLFFANWSSCSAEVQRQLYNYALVRRVFDSLRFLTEAMSSSKSGGQFTMLCLTIKAAKDGTILRVRDPYEDFLAAVSECDLRRLRSCPICHRFFVAWRVDRKACSARCANQLRVHRFRAKQPEYLANRKFRKRTGLPAVRRGRHQLMALHQALTKDDKK